MVLEDQNWKITLDSVNHIRATIESLVSLGGHAITHVGRMIRTNQKLFGIKEIEKVMTLLDPFISFLNGDRCSLVLPVAYDSFGHEIWRGWNTGSNIPWTGKPNWSKNVPAHLSSKSFSGYVQLWDSLEWQSLIKLVIEWYLQGKQGTAETALLIGQSALESIARFELVECENPTFTGNAFRCLTASEKIRKRLIRDSRRLRDQEADQRPQQRLAPLSDVVNELEETEIQRQLFLRNPPVGT